MGGIATAPDLPGCVACSDGLEQTEELMKEAIDLYVQALKEAGRPVPQPTTKAKPVAVAT